MTAMTTTPQFIAGIEIICISGRGSHSLWRAVCNRCGLAASVDHRGYRVGYRKAKDEALAHRCAVKAEVPKPRASERAYQLRDAVMDMAGRYGLSTLRAGMASGSGSPEGKTWGHWHRAAGRQYRALQRLSAALRDLDA